MATDSMLYEFSSIGISISLFILILLFNELGFRIGVIIQRRTDEELKALTSTIQASILGLLALLLGFTFSMSMQRFDNRNHAVIEEANAIGTTLLRVELLPETQKQQAKELLNQYVQLRVNLASIDITQTEERRSHNQQVVQLQNALWAIAVEASNQDPRPVTTGAFINSLNAMIDAQSKRNALLYLHVPEVVMLLLFVVFMSSVGILGYSSGLSGKRVSIPTVMVSFLIVMIVFIIIDLDRPKRGLIQVNQQPLLELLQQ